MYIVRLTLVVWLFMTNTVMNLHADPQKDQPSSIIFSQEDIKAAEEYLKKLKKREGSATTQAESLQRKVTASSYYYGENYDASSTQFEMVVSYDPTDGQAWLLLADSIYHVEQSGYVTDDRNPLWAVIHAYQNTKDPLDKAAILKFLAMSSDNYKDAILQQLKNQDNNEIDERLNYLKTDYPHIFNVYEVETPDKADVGTACFKFTKSLLKQKSFHYEDYIDVQPKVKNLGVVAKNNRLCVSGLQFGSSYKIKLKKGLSGERNYKLSEDRSLDVLVKHRTPSLTFRERGYILSANGPQLLPLKAINVDQVKIKVLKVPSQNLASLVSHDNFQFMLYEWNFNQLMNNTAELVAEGLFDARGQMDETLIRGLPLDKVLGNKLESGLYVIQASVEGQPSYNDSTTSTQWLIVSDLALSTYKGPDGLHVDVRSLSTAAVIPDVELSLIARNGRNLGTVKTNAAGEAHFDEKLLAGKESNQPVMLQALSKNNDFSFLSFRKEGFDFSDRGVKGRDPVEKADAYLYTERGIYRPGDSVTITALLRDNKGRSLKGTPLTFKIFRPDGIEAYTELSQESGAGAHQFTLETQATSYTGTWNVTAHLDPKGPAVGQTKFSIQDFIPPRVEVKLDIPQKVVRTLDTLLTDVKARYYYGPVASDLKVEGLTDLILAEEPFEQWKGYQFGLEEETWVPLKFKAASTTTNEKGGATVSTTINVYPDTTKILNARSHITVFEAGGRGQTSTQKTLFWHQPYALGLSAQFKDRSSPALSDAVFNIIAIDEKGALKKIDQLKYTLYEETHGFTWYRNGSGWNYEVAIEDRALSSGNIKLSEDKPTPLKVPVKYGYYRLEVLDEKLGVATSYRFHAGWNGDSETPDRPDMIELALNKKKDQAVDKVSLTVKPPFSGELVISATNDQVFKTLYRGKADEKGTVVNLNIDKELLEKSGTYLMATVFRPQDIKSEKTSNRAIGLIWLDNKAGMPKLEPTLVVPEVIRPEAEFEAKVCLAKPSSKPYARVTVVDEAILQLTRFESPDPFDYFFEQTKLAYAIRDSYGQLINPFGARPGDYKVGGDGFEQKALAKLAARTFKTVSFSSKIIDNFTQGSSPSCQQEATVRFKLPEFSGQVRVMAVVWDDEATGATEFQATVKDPLETYIALPRFLSPSDQTTIVVDAQNLTDRDGTFNLNLNTEGAVDLVKAFSQKVTLSKEQLIHLPVDISAKDNGVGTLKLHVAGEGLTLNKNWQIAVRSARAQTTVQKNGVLKPGEKVGLDESLRQNMVAGSGAVSLSLGTSPDFGATALRKELREYPYSCLEQSTSRLVGELYQPKEKQEKGTIENIMGSLIALQRFDGPFALWSANDDAEAWLSMYALDLLNRAHSDQYEISPAVLNRGTVWIQETINRSSTDTRFVGVQAYGYYILAKLGKGNMGALKYFADNNQGHLKSVVDLSFIGAAFALYGDAQAAKTWFDKAVDAYNREKESKPAEQLKHFAFYQSDLSDLAILVSLLGETIQEHPQLMDLARQLADKASAKPRSTTFEKGWLVRASYALSTLEKPFKVSIDKEIHEGKSSFSVEINQENLKDTIIRNEGESPILYTLTSTGDISDPSLQPNKGFEIKRTVYQLNGEPADLGNVHSGELLVVVLNGKLQAPHTHQVMLLDLLPAGFEIETVKFEDDYLKQNFMWLDKLTPLSRVEKRDDRYFAAFQMQEIGAFKTVYFVRALNPGVYTMPSAVVESMYRPEYIAYSEQKTLTIKP